MKIRIPHSAFCIISFLALLHFSVAAGAASFDVIIAGKGGEKEFDDRFAQWSSRLQNVLIEKMAHPAANVIQAKSNLDGIRGALADVSARVKSDDLLFVYLIGHGSFQNGESKFMIEGPDLAAGELKTWLEKIHAREIVVINAASSSAGFINALSGPQRIIGSATKSVDEHNATDFMEYFIQGLEDQSADLNRDGRISVLEACAQAAALTQAAYTGRGLILTEHALIDDNGDGLGTRLPLGVQDGSRKGGMAADPRESLDGPAAATVFIKDFNFPPSIPAALVKSYTAAIDEVERLKQNKGKMNSADYAAQLETLLVKAARISREIHRKM